MRPLLNSYLETFIWQTLATHNVIVHSISEGIISPSNHGQQIISRIAATCKDKDVLTRIKDSKASLDRRRNSGDLYYDYAICAPYLQNVYVHIRERIAWRLASYSSAVINPPSCISLSCFSFLTGSSWDCTGDGVSSDSSTS